MSASASTKSREEEKAILRYGGWIEAIPYFLLGTFTLGVGLATAGLWAMEQWLLGAHVRVALGALLVAVLLAGFFVATRRRNPVLALACLVAWCGTAAYVLAGWGWQLPAIGS